MLRSILMVVAYTSIITVSTYLVIYSALYDWWKSALGIVLNSSLISVALVAAGAAIRFADDDLGRVLSIVGWLLFNVFLVARLRLFFVAYKKRQQELEDISERNS